jgi:hypothetical protein
VKAFARELARELVTEACRTFVTYAITDWWERRR